MQPSEHVVTKTEKNSAWNGVERRRVEKVVETLATLGGRGESLSAVAHDARNMVAALGLYCDLLEEPGVLAAPFTHYAQELRLVAAASRRLVEKLVALDSSAASINKMPGLLEAHAGRRTVLAGAATDGAAAKNSGAATTIDSRAGANTDDALWEGSGGSPILHAAAAQEWKQRGASRRPENRRVDLLPALPVSNLAAELLANRNLLAALAGPSVVLTMETDGGAQAARLTGEDLTRLLVNLVKNAAEAMLQAQNSSESRRIHIGLGERETAQGAAPCLVLTVEDNGPGIPEEALEKIFTSGYTSRSQETAAGGGWPQSHRGLGLAIVRSIVEGAGGRITASNRAQGGACFTLELPVRNTGSRQ